MKDRMAIGEQARAVMLGDADDHRNERQQLLAENGAVRQQLGQAQAEIERLHSSLRESLTHQKS